MFGLSGRYWNAAQQHFMQSIPNRCDSVGKIWNMERGNFAWLNSASTNSHHLLQTWQLSQKPLLRRKSVINVHQVYVHSTAAVDSKISRNLLNFHARTSEKRRRRSHPSRSHHYPGSFELTRPYHSILTHGAVVVVLLSHRENGKLFRAPAFCALRKICNAVFCSLQDFITVVSLPLHSTLHARQIKNASCKVQWRCNFAFYATRLGCIHVIACHGLVLVVRHRDSRVFSLLHVVGLVIALISHSS